MLVDIDKLDRALDRVIEAAVDHSLWPEILEGVAAATNAFGVNIVPMKGMFRSGLVATDSLLHAMEGYFDGGWDKREWRLRGMPLLTRNGTVLEQHYSTREDFAKQEYYKAQSKYGLGRTCIVGLSSKTDMLCFVLHRRINDDPFDIEDERVFRAMRDRLMSSAQIMWNAAAQRLTGMMEAFELARLGAVFFDRFGKVTTMNDAARSTLGRHLQVTMGELHSASSSETALIKRRVDAVLNGGTLGVTGDQPIVIRPFDARPITLRIQRLGKGLTDVFSPSAGVCLIEDLGAEISVGSDRIANVLGLTKSEAALAILLASGLSPRDAASRRGTSYETVRTQLRSIFDKTGTRRQSEIVALITRLRAIS